MSFVPYVFLSVPFCMKKLASGAQLWPLAIFYEACTPAWRVRDFALRGVISPSSAGLNPTLHFLWFDQGKHFRKIFEEGTEKKARMRYLPRVLFGPLRLRAPYNPEIAAGRRVSV
jgi:hypothetical protein